MVEVRGWMSEKGFTLLESLVVLFIALTMSSIIFQFTYQFMQEQTEKEAINLLIATIHDMQSYAMAHNMYTRLDFMVQDGTSYYVVQNAKNERLIVQALPEGMHLNHGSTLKTVTYQPSGNILEFGTVLLNTQNGKIRLAFQMQRGRVIVHVE
ncbi:MAG TPA: competence type IV pilus minor pilin ComGD [Sporosarcina sp.]|nr:competence type IV pilus minor pilin ComGD [Sporosarcina sp.]